MPSFHPALPTWGLALLALVPPLLVLLYVLKLKRRPVLVSCTLLWRRSAEDLHVNSLWRRLRRNLLLLLQLLAAAALLLAAVAPRLAGTSGGGARYILLLDNSASMAARDGEPTRLDQAKRLALERIAAADDGDVGMVIAFNDTAEVRQSFTADKALLAAAVRGVGPTHRPTRLDEALALAESLANPPRSAENEAVAPPNAAPGQARTYVAAEGAPAEVHLFTDGRFADVPDFAPGRLDLSRHPVGRPGQSDNLAIVKLDAVRDAADPGEARVFVRVLNFRREGAAPDVLVEAAVGGVRRPAVKAVPLPARGEAAGEATVTFTVSGLGLREEVVIHARLMHGGDVLPVDDEAWVVLRQPRRPRVLVAGADNPVLRHFFDGPSVRAAAEVSYLPPGRLADRKAYLDPARDGDFDLVVFDRCGPATADELPRANTLFLGHPPPPWSADALQRVANPSVVGWSDRHPATRDLRGLYDVRIAEALRLPELPPRTPRPIEGERGLVLLAALDRPPFTDLVLAFPLLTPDGKWNTTWPLEASFPLFLHNVLEGYAGVGAGSADAPLGPGRPITFRTPAGIGRVSVRPPAGDGIDVTRGPDGDFTFGATDRPGAYAAEWAGGGRSFAVDLFDESESDPEPRSDVRVGAAVVAAGTGTRPPRELWPLALVAAAGLLLVEWVVFARRAGQVSRAYPASRR